ETARQPDGAPNGFAADGALDIVNGPDSRNARSTRGELPPQVRVDEVAVHDVRPEAADRRRDPAHGTRIRVEPDRNLDGLDGGTRGRIEERLRLRTGSEDDHRHRVAGGNERGEERQQVAFAAADALHLL